MVNNDITLSYGTPRWYKCERRLPSNDPKVKTGLGGLTEEVIVAIMCNNGQEFISMDRYDSFTKSWEKHTTENGQHVIAWTKLDLPW